LLIAAAPCWAGHRPPLILLPACLPACSQIKAAGGLKKLLFDWGFARKLFFIKAGYKQSKVGLSGQQ